MYCKSCGKQFSDTARFCPACGTEVSGFIEQGGAPPYNPPATPISEEQPQEMKWFKFVIYVQLFLAALASLSQAALYATGARYEAAESSAELVYGFFPELHTADMCCAVANILLAIFAIVVRFQLAGYKRNAWKGYLAYTAAAALVSIAYIVVASSIVGESMLDSNMVTSLISSIVLIIANFIYFKKRDHLFVN